MWGSKYTLWGGDGHVKDGPGVATNANNAETVDDGVEIDVLYQAMVCKEIANSKATSRVSPSQTNFISQLKSYTHNYDNLYEGRGEADDQREGVHGRDGQGDQPQHKVDGDPVPGQSNPYS